MRGFNYNLMDQDWTMINPDSPGKGYRPKDFDNPDEYVCFYCKNKDQTSLVKCEDNGCSRWFCNSTIKGVSDSHIVSHLNGTSHKKIGLHPSNNFADITIECSECSSRNAFLLGFVLSLVDSKIKYLCRTPCSLSTRLDETK